MAQDTLKIGYRPVVGWRVASLLCRIRASSLFRQRWHDKVEGGLTKQEKMAINRQAAKLKDVNITDRYRGLLD